MSLGEPVCLVTGGAGFIGSHFVDLLLREEPGWRVLTVDRLTYAGSLANLESAERNPRHRFARADICDREAMRPLVANADRVVHFGAETHVDRAIAGGVPFARTNMFGTGVLLDEFRRAPAAGAAGGERRLFLHISTDEVYGPLPFGRADEEAPLLPTNPYAASKAGADLLALSYYATHGLPVVVARSANAYGPRQHREKMIPTFFEAALTGGALPVYGDGRQVREWMFVEDLCRALLRLFRSGEPGRIYNIGAEKGAANLDMAERVLELARRKTGRVGRIEHVADRPGHDRRYAIDASRMRALGWKPEVTLEEGLERTCDWLAARLADSRVDASPVSA